MPKSNEDARTEAFVDIIHALYHAGEYELVKKVQELGCVRNAFALSNGGPAVELKVEVIANIKMWRDFAREYVGTPEGANDYVLIQAMRQRLNSSLRDASVAHIAKLQEGDVVEGPSLNGRWLVVDAHKTDDADEGPPQGVYPGGWMVTLWWVPPKGEPSNTNSFNGYQPGHSGSYAGDKRLEGVRVVERWKKSVDVTWSKAS